MPGSVCGVGGGCEGEGVMERVEGEKEDVWESEREGCGDPSLLPQAKLTNPLIVFTIPPLTLTV